MKALTDLRREKPLKKHGSVNEVAKQFVNHALALWVDLADIDQDNGLGTTLRNILVLQLLGEREVVSLNTTCFS